MATIFATPDTMIVATPVVRRLDPAGAELTTLGLSLVVGILAYAYGGGFVDVGNVLIPVVLLVTMSAGAQRMLRLDPANLWTPILWMRVAAGIYFGLGALVPIFASAAALTYIEAFFQFFADDVLKLNLIVLTYLFILLGSVKILERLTEYRRRQGARPFFSPRPSVLNFLSIGIVFLGVGSLITFGVLLPIRFGLSNLVLPNVVNEIGMLSYVGLFFLGSWAFSRGGVAIIPVLAIAMAYVGLGIVSFSKTDTLFPIVLMGIAFVFNRPNLWRIIIVVAITVGAYFVANQIVQGGREYMIARYNSLEGASLDERIEIIRRVQNQNEIRERGAINYGVTRLSYTNVGSFVVAEYDRGVPGNSTRNALATLVPRFLWPNKPIISDVARELSYNATGIYDNSVAPSLPADSYWTNGWAGVVIWGVAAGTLLWLWSCYSIAVLRNEAWHLFAVVLIGAKLGARIDGFLVVDLLGPIPIAIVAHFLISGLNTLLSWNK